MNEYYAEIDWNAVISQMSSKEVGRRITEARSRHEMSLEQLAVKMHKSRSTVSRIERGIQEITIEQLYGIAEILEVSSFDLLSD